LLKPTKDNLEQKPPDLEIKTIDLEEITIDLEEIIIDPETITLDPELEMISIIPTQFMLEILPILSMKKNYNNSLKKNSKLLLRV